MKNHEVKALFKTTLEDFQLSRNERGEIRDLLDVIKGNEQKLEINSNLDRIRVPERGSPPNFRWKANNWYTLKARVDVNSNGSGVVRAKAWPRDEAEPEGWNVEFKHNSVHKSGSPGLFGFSPQEMPVYIDNVKVTPNR